MIKGKIPCVNKNLSVFTFNSTNRLATTSANFVDQSLDDIGDKDD